MVEQSFSGQFTALLLEGLAHYRKGEMSLAMKAWEAAYHTEAGNPQAREFLRTALLRLHAELDKQSGRAHPWLPDLPAVPLPQPTSPWDEGPSRALPDGPPPPITLPTPANTARLQTPAELPRLPRKPPPPAVRAPVPPPPPHEDSPEPPPLHSRTLTFARPPPPPPDAILEEAPHARTLTFARPKAATLVPPVEEALSRAWRDSEAELQKVEQQRTATDAVSLLREARERLSRRDFGGALELTAQVLAAEPAHPEAHLIEAECEAGLTEAYEAALGGLQKSPRLLLPPERLTRLQLDSTAGFLLSQIDGEVTYEELFSISHLSRLETARILARLVREGIVGL